jgi:transposase
VFSKGKEASACIGLTPLQHSSGEVTKLGHIRKSARSNMLRSQLITGAMTAASQMVKRTAYVMLTQGTEYKAELVVA